MISKKSILCLIVLCTGCASYGNSRFADSQKMRGEIAKNISSPEQLVEKYGQPEQIFMKDGQQVYEYRYISVNGFPEEEYTDGAKHYNMSYVYVYFDEQILTQVENITRRGPFPPEDVFAPFNH